MAPVAVLLSSATAFTARMPSDHWIQLNRVTGMPASRTQSHNEAQDLLLLQDYVCKLSHTQRTLEDTYALLQQTELLAGVINEQDCRAIRTACCCLKSLRIRVEARANVTERAVISRQLQLMQASIQHYPTEDLNTADTSCPSRTSAEHFDTRPGPCPENERSHPCTNVAEPATMVNRPHRIQLAATHAFVDR